jgi:ribulose-5-phosphate 4-epimerase/fuculose-1-phosphate aldolase
MAVTDFDTLKEQLVQAREFLREDGLIARYGHLSAYAPDEQLVLITPNAASVRGRMTPADVLTITLDGEPVAGDYDPPIEWIIHTAIHRARPDALSVIHTHPMYSTSLTIAGQKLRPVYQHGAILGEQPVPIYDDPAIITTPEDAAALVQVLDKAPIAELRGHGSVTVGRSITEAWAAAVFLEDNSRKQFYATLAGTPRFLTPDEIRRASRSVSPNSLQGLWEYYSHRHEGG